MAFVTERPDVKSHIKTGQYLEWITELPSGGHYDRDSPVFLLKSNKCHFQLKRIRGFRWKLLYDVYLKFQNKCRGLDSFRVHFEVGFKNEETLSYHKGGFNIFENVKILRIHWDDLQSKSPPDWKTSDGLKFLFYFDNVPLLKFVEETGGTAVQTPIYMDNILPLKDVSTDLSKLFDEGADHDAEFICGNEVIKAHKIVLCCRSGVFASMFRSDMMENKTGQVKIQDMEGSVFRQFLRYLYAGVLPELTVDLALLLYKVADKYAVDTLKAQCTDFLTENLSPENACEVLIEADRHNDPDFKKNCMEYVIEKEIQFVKEKWTGFCTENPTLASEVFNLFCQNARRHKKKTTVEQCAN